MSGVRVLVGTRKGAFVLSSDDARRDWDISGPHFAGWEIYHLKGSPADPDRLYASQSGGWFGQLIQRSDDGGRTWNAVGNEFSYEGDAGNHQYFDGTSVPWKFTRVWHLEPSLHDPDTIYAGVEDAALFRSIDGGGEWQELPGLRGHGTGPSWQPGAGGMCLHTIVLDPRDEAHMTIAISAAGMFRTDDGGKTWRPINRGLRSEGIPDPDAEVGHCVHHIAAHATRPTPCSCRSTGTSCAATTPASTGARSAATCRRTSASRSTCTPTSPRRSTSCRSRATTLHFPPDGKLRVYRSRTGGNEWEPLTRACRRSTATSTSCATRWPSTRSTSAASTSARPAGRCTCRRRGDTWSPIVRDLPAVLSVEVQTLP